MTAMLSSRPGPAIRRIAIVGHSALVVADRWGGLIQALRADGHAVLCLAPDMAEPLAPCISPDLRRLDVECAAIPFAVDQRLWSDFSTNRALSAQLRAWRPHAAIVMGHKLGPMAAAAAKSAGAAPVLLAVAGLGSAGSELAHAASMRKAFVSGCTALCANAGDARAVRDLAGMTPVQVAPCGVDFERVKLQPLPAVGTGFVFAMAAPMIADQGIEAYCEAAVAIKARSPQTRFLLKALEHAAPAVRIKEALAAAGTAVEIAGAPDDLVAFLASAHTVVAVPVRDGLLTPAQTAMALGRPLIVSDCAGVRDLVDESVNGHCIVAGDGSALAEAMMAVLRRKDLVPAMGRASRAKAERNYDRRVLVPQMYAALGLTAKAAGKAA
jgi:glycosyltransferase involved in cell wall biosynthesis